jgi:energy-coupling factor transporter transmembrane protein EcfT
MYLNRLEIKHDILRSFDPRARLITACALLLLSVSLVEYAALFGMIAVCLALLYRDLVCAAKRLIPLETFCLLFLIQTAVGFITTRTAAVFILRVNCAALVYMLLVIPLGPGTLAQTLACLKVNQKLISILYLSSRYIYVMHDKVIFAAAAMRFRASPYQRGTIAAWKSFAAVFAAALVSAFIQADAVSAALLSRGFDGAIPKTVVLVWRVKDTLLAAGGGAVLLLYGTYKIFGCLFFL